MEINSLPPKTSRLLNDYFTLNLGGRKVATPYYRNVKRVRAELRSKVGKGLPEEIEQETRIYAKLRGFDLEGKSQVDIREFMRSQGLGVDCSGFVAHLLDCYFNENDRGSLLRNIKFPAGRSVYQRIATRLRPIEHIGADLLTSEINTYPVTIKKVMPADLLRLKGVYRGDHIAIVTEVHRDDDGHVARIKYAHSTQHYNKADGVRIGEIDVIDEGKELLAQNWLELDTKGNCWTRQQLEKAGEDGGLRRIKL